MALMAATLQRHFERLYGDRGAAQVGALQKRIESFRSTSGSLSEANDARWSEKDVVLIAYADQIRSEALAPLASLRGFLDDYHLLDCINTLHLLPFFPSSSDDGFSVVDYHEVDPKFGTWNDVAALGERFHLMLDLVLNHVSRQSAWFQGFLAGASPFDRFFITPDAIADLTAVTRPRNHALLTKFETSSGPRNVWTTFSDDQVDLNYHEPEVLLRILGVLLDYVRRGARIIRLDAVAYLWKEIGTNCIHRPEVHEIVKLMRDVLKYVAPHVILLTETNVPHEENVRYFGEGDEAHLVYQFSLPPLVVDAVLNEDASVLSDWLEGACETRAGTTFFNFTASHDGIGVRPLEGLVSRDRFNRLLDATTASGGKISYRRLADGTEEAYELNISYLNAIAGRDESDTPIAVRKFLLSQGIMLALRGIPGVYFHSLVGTENDAAAAAQTCHARRINRRKFDRAELDRRLSDRGQRSGAIFARYREMLRTRIEQKAFHPEAPQRILRIARGILAFQRTSIDQSERVFVLANFQNESVDINLSELAGRGELYDLLSTTTAVSGRCVRLRPHQIVWLREHE